MRVIRTVDQNLVVRARVIKAGRRVLKAIRNGGNALIFVAAVIAALGVIVALVVSLLPKSSAGDSRLYQTVAALTAGMSRSSLVAQLGPPDFVATWSSPRGVQQGAPEGGPQDEWVLKLGGRPQALVVALTDQRTKSVAFVAVIALRATFRPTFYPVHGPKRGITLNSSRIGEVLPQSDLAADYGEFASIPGFYLESDYPQVTPGEPGFVIGVSGVGDQAPPYALIKSLPLQLDPAQSYSSSPALQRSLAQPKLSRSRASTVIDTYAQADGWPALYEAWRNGVRLPKRALGGVTT